MKFLIQCNLLFIFLLVSVSSFANGTDTQDEDLATCDSSQLTKHKWEIYWANEKDYVTEGETLVIEETRPNSGQFNIQGAVNARPIGPFDGSCSDSLYVIEGTVRIPLETLDLRIVRMKGAHPHEHEAGTKYTKHILLKFSTGKLTHPGDAHGGEE